MTEFGLIEHIRMLCATLPTNGFEGIGDDCAVLPIGGGESLVFTSDMLCEGVHFLREATSAAELGAKSLAVNLSDVASMGAKPVATLLSLSLPPEVMQTWIGEFMEGYRDLAARFDTALVGGDTTASKGGITINVTAIGRVSDTHIKRRSAAHVGDMILTAGMLGESTAGLREILAGNFATPLAAIHRNPLPQVNEGLWLGARTEVHAMMDLSDGLASDIRHIMNQSGVGANINLEQIPTTVDIRSAICGGEDYKLLLTAAPEQLDALCSDFLARFGAPLYPIGRVTSTHELVWCENGTPTTDNFQGFRHY